MTAREDGAFAAAITRIIRVVYPEALTAISWTAGPAREMSEEGT